ncbi:hypothetical protein [Xenorhabdus bovienii]|uniref:hypothetical protein n=1 Tax=Xenorhabdus bovienii TaxID=40576 RepID=UPI00237C936C|nr:hypothetical protein [Xenorhabdus bovienii]MDE1492355.1 hypothetical protein [Xenorhabdus bovienii]
MIEIKRFLSGVDSAHIYSNGKEIVVVDRRWRIEIISDKGLLVDVIEPEVGL